LQLILFTTDKSLVAKRGKLILSLIISEMEVLLFLPGFKKRDNRLKGPATQQVIIPAGRIRCHA